MPAKRLRVPKRSTKTRERSTDKDNAGLSPQVIEEWKAFFEQKFPSLRNSALANRYARMRSRRDLSIGERMMAEIGILQQAFYKVKTRGEKRDIVKTIRNLTSNSSTMEFIGLYDRSHRRKA